MYKKLVNAVMEVAIKNKKSEDDDYINNLYKDASMIAAIIGEESAIKILKSMEE